jgi:pyruvate dehydrogenase phosphatase
MSAINSPDQLVKRRSAAAANQPKNYATSPSDASKPSSFKRVWLLLAATGLLAGHFYYRSSSGNASVTDSAAHAPKTEEEKMAFDEVNKKLRMKEAVYPVNAGSVVERYEINYIPSNSGLKGLDLSCDGAFILVPSSSAPFSRFNQPTDPFEDYHDEKRSADGSRFFFGMYDGHGGWEAATIIQEYLSAYVAFEVENAVGKELPLDAKLEPAAHAERRKKIDAAITRAFLRLDGDLLNGSLVLPGTTDSMPLRDQMRSSFAGACGLFAFIDGLDLYVACAGDARAVLGRRTGGGYETVALSQDQTPRNADELRRLMLEHPGEEHSVVMNGRVLGGLMPSRAFGLVDETKACLGARLLTP